MIRLRFRSGRLLSHSLVMLRFTCNRDVFEFGRRTLVVNGRTGWLSRCVRSFQRPCTSSRCSLLSASETFEQEISWTPVVKPTDSSTWFFVLVQSSGWSLIIGHFASLRYFDDVSSVSITLGDSQTFDTQQWVPKLKWWPPLAHVVGRYMRSLRIIISTLCERFRARSERARERLRLYATWLVRCEVHLVCERWWVVSYCILNTKQALGVYTNSAISMRS